MHAHSLARSLIHTHKQREGEKNLSGFQSVWWQTVELIREYSILTQAN